MENNQVSLFEENELTKSANNLSIVKARFISFEQYMSRELFEGYNKIKAITYSSGISFMANILSNFDESDVIFGLENIVDNNIAAVLSVQNECIKQLTKNKSAEKLACLVEERKLNLYVSRETKSHMKIYILSSENKTRVIVGSSNFSYSAFSGIQGENIILFDDDEEAFKYYNDLFDDFVDKCSNNISHSLFQNMINDNEYLENNINELPILKDLEKGKIVYLEATDNYEEAEIVQNVKGFEDQLKPLIPKIKPDNNKFILSDGVEFKTFKKRYKEESEKRVLKRRKLSKLHINYETSTLSFNEKELNLNPKKEEILNDIECINQFMDGLNAFSGEVEETKKEFYKYLNWFFSSIFNPYLRYIADKTNYEVLLFPVYGIMYGESNGGKSRFTELLTKLMCGKEVSPASTDDFSYNKIVDMKRGIEGLPINIDDLAKTQYSSNGEKVIKDDTWGLTKDYINYPAVSISTNKIPSLSHDITKRVVTSHINSEISKTEGARLGKKVKELIKHASCSLFCEYTRRMLPRVSEMVEQMKSDKVEYFPDIFKLSSEVLYEIFEENLDIVPDYISKLSHSDYFGDDAIGYNAKRKIIKAYEVEPQQFKINKKRDELIYSYPDSVNPYELRYLSQELPPKLECKAMSRTIVMKYSEAVKYFGISFKKRFSLLGTL